MCVITSLENNLNSNSCMIQARAMPDPDHVIQAFIDGSLERLAESRGEFTAGEYRQGLKHFAARTLERRCLDLSMTDVVSWFSDTPHTANMLRHIARFGKIIRVVGPASSERLAFRHDRVREWLHADAAADLMRRDAMPEAVLKEPYFAEIIGAALVRDDIPIATVEQAKTANPLSLFCAMRVFGKPVNDQHYAILRAAEAWLDDAAAHEPHHNNLRWTALHVLSEFDAPYVTSLVQRFRKEQNNWWGLRASFRNGDFVAGIKLCHQHGPGIRVVGHLELIDHVQRCRGTSLVRTLDDLLRRDQLTRQQVWRLEASRPPRWFLKGRALNLWAAAAGVEAQALREKVLRLEVRL